MFEYAASIYPLAYSEVRIANGYSIGLVNALKSATTSPQGKEYLSLITKSIQAADADIKRMEENVSGKNVFVPPILMLEGTVFNRLYSLGAADAGRAEPYFQKAVQYAADVGLKSGSFYQFNYAAFLVTRYGNARLADIKKLLMPFRAGNEAEIYPGVIEFFKLARTNLDLEVRKATIVTLTKIDSDFKTYLISLGWKVSDF